MYLCVGMGVQDRQQGTPSVSDAEPLPDRIVNGEESVKSHPPHPRCTYRSISPVEPPSLVALLVVVQSGSKRCFLCLQTPRDMALPEQEENGANKQGTHSSEARGHQHRDT